jgi:hypothetical protein
MHVNCISNGFSQVHIDNLAKRALEISKQKGSSFVLAEKVDDASIRKTENAVQTFQSGATLYKKD